MGTIKIKIKVDISARVRYMNTLLLVHDQFITLVTCTHARTHADTQMHTHGSNLGCCEKNRPAVLCRNCPQNPIYIAQQPNPSPNTNTKLVNGAECAKHLKDQHLANSDSVSSHSCDVLVASTAGPLYKFFSLVSSPSRIHEHSQ